MEEMTIREQLEEKIASIKQHFAECGGRISVHLKHLDDPKKGASCPNRRARMHYMQQRARFVTELSALEAQVALLAEGENSRNDEGNAVTTEAGGTPSPE